MADNEQGGKRTSKQVMGSVEAEIEKGRAEGFKKKLGDLVRKHNEQKRGVEQTEEEIKLLCDAFDAGKSV